MIKMGRTLEQILETEKPAVKAQAEAQAKAMLLNIQLAKIRALAQKTQAEMAETLDVKQPTVAGTSVSAGRFVGFNFPTEFDNTKLDSLNGILDNEHGTA